jgi:hypothetical protein
MGGASSAEMAARSSLVPPLWGNSAAQAGVIGTYKLDAELNTDNCGSTSMSSDVFCCLYRGEFRVPWPCNCCGQDCCCCPHSPKGPQWEVALAAGFGQLLAEAGTIAMYTQPMAVMGGNVSVQAALGNARNMTLAPWVQKANAFLRPHGLSCAVYNWVEEKRDDKGGKVGEVLRCAIQIYQGAGPQVILVPVPQHFPGQPQEYSSQPQYQTFQQQQQFQMPPPGFASAPPQVYPEGYTGPHNGAVVYGAPKSV